MNLRGHTDPVEWDAARLALLALRGNIHPARTLAADASALFARNLTNFLTAFWDKEAGAPVLPDGDEIVTAIRLTRGGHIVNERLKTPQ